MNKKLDVWKFINRCVICGSKLKFEASLLEGSKPEEGTKFCEQNHARFSVIGAYTHPSGEFYMWYRYPPKQVRVTGRSG